MVGSAMLMIENRDASIRPLSQSSGWERFVSNDNQFAILFPTKPNRESDIVNTPYGKVELIQYMSKTGDVLYAVAYGDYPIKALTEKNPEQLLDNARNGFVENVQGNLLSEIVISKGNYLGREIAVKVKPDTIMTVQIVLKENRLYQVIVVTNSDKLFTSQRKEFFESFEILR